MFISNMHIFLQQSICYRMVAASSSVAMGGVTPYTFFLKVPWVNKQLATSDFTFEEEIKGRWCEIRQ